MISKPIELARFNDNRIISLLYIATVSPKWRDTSAKDLLFYVISPITRQIGEIIWENELFSLYLAKFSPNWRDRKVRLRE